jgi:predicted alpha/beta superfamily hydrolase
VLALFKRGGKMYQTFEIEIKELNRIATAYVYLPKSYDSNKSYPVLYMHDAHNLFDDKTATYGHSWKIMEAFEENDLPELIVCGVNCAEGLSRLDEYSPFVDTNLKHTYSDAVNRDVGGLGDVYLDWLVHTFKPIIDERYNTKPEQEYTAIMGSSMGGLISAYAAFKYSDVFSRIGAVSTAYFFAWEQMKALLIDGKLENIITFYSDVGDNETSGDHDISQVYLDLNAEASKVLKEKLGDKFKYQVIKDGIHSETSWSTRVASIIKYLYSDIKE